jgi:hypothetical protein
MAREATVSGSLPIPAIAFGQNVSKSLKPMFAPCPTQTVVFPPRRWPELTTPRSASAYSRSPLKAASDSSSRRGARAHRSCAGARLPSCARSATASPPVIPMDDYMDDLRQRAGSAEK